MHEVQPSKKQKHIIGIELGTHSTRVARFNEAGKAAICYNSEGYDATPSVVQFYRSGGVMVGTEAKKFIGCGIGNIYAEFRREMGTEKSWTLDNRTITPIELTAILLKKVIADYTAQFDLPDVIAITWPANFRNEQREATKEAVIQSGLNINNVHFIEEPTAAALYYATEKPLFGKYLIYDFGGGTFNVTLIEAAGNDITVLYQDGVQQLGGKDLDAALLKIIADKFNAKTGIKFDSIDCHFSKVDIEYAKTALSIKDKIQMRLISARCGPVRIDITRNEFEAGISHLVSQVEMACENVLRCGKDDPSQYVEKSDIKEIFMCGGTSRVPAIQNSVERLFGKKPTVKNLDQAIALGAAIYAAINTPGLSVFQEEGLPDIDVKLVAPHYIGTTVFSNDGSARNETVIAKGTPIPCSVERIYYTSTDNQANIQFDVTQSAVEESNPDFVSTIWSGKFTLPPGCRIGHPVKTTFCYDANGCFKFKINTTRPNDEGDGPSITVDLIPA